MEIQDRNSLLQILTGVRDANPQFSSAEGNAFAEVLKSTQNEASIPQKNAENVDFKPVIGQSNTSNDVKDVEKKVFAGDKSVSNKKDSPKKAETPKSENQESKNKTEEDNAEKSVAANQPAEKVDNAKVTENDDAQVSEDETAYTEESVDGKIVEGQEMAPENVMVQGLEADVLMSVFQEVSATTDTENVVMFDDVAIVQDVVQNNLEEMPLTEVLKQEVVSNSKTATEELVPMSKEEALLMEQAKFLDEKITSDKKLKIQVNVSEEKIADPVVKDVLKNSFEVNSMFQSVDTEDAPEVLIAEADVLTEKQASADSEVATLPEIKTNVAYNEVKVAQDSMKTVSPKDASVISVSGKEVVAEVANVSKAEAFAKINEASTRDNFKGMAKEVVEQIKVNITKSAIKGVDTIDIQLKPEDLGKIQIKMHIAKDGKIQAEIVTSRAETADLLQKDASSLSKAFNEAGYDTDSKSFTFSFREENQPKGQEKDNADLLKFIGDSLEQEAENMAGNDNLTYDPILGLNIKV